MSDIVGRVFLFFERHGFEEREMSESESRLRESGEAIRSTEPIEESGPTAAEIEGGARRALWIGLGGAGAAIAATIWVMFWGTSAGSPSKSSVPSAATKGVEASKTEPKGAEKASEKPAAEESKSAAKPPAGR